jgi:hypothetical protein
MEITVPKGSNGTLHLFVLVVVGAMLASVILHWAEDKARRWRQNRLIEGKSTVPFTAKQYPATAPQTASAANVDAYDPSIYN